jgi:hypothetical protein
MNHTRYPKTFLLLLTAACLCAGQENFKQGDSWEYEYHKNANFYYGPTPYDQSTDTMIGKITVYLDSVLRRPDSTLWYLRVHDSVRVWQKKGATGGYRFITTNFTIDSTYRKIIATGQGPDTATYWEYSKVLAPTAITPDFVAFDRQTDTMLSGCAPVCSTTVSRKTSVGVCVTGIGQNYELLTQEVNKSFYADTANSSEDNIVTSWSNSIGLCQKIFLSRFISPVSEVPQKPETGSNWERFILVRHNGSAVTILATGVQLKNSDRPHVYKATKNAPIYFDLQGRRIQAKFGKLPGHGKAVQLSPDGQGRLRCIVER